MLPVRAWFPNLVCRSAALTGLRLVSCQVVALVGPRCRKSPWQAPPYMVRRLVLSVFCARRIGPTVDKPDIGRFLQRL